MAQFYPAAWYYPRVADARTIIHADMDAFYASVEQRDNPDLRGRPVVVGGPARRGVVSAASYEARRFGIHSAMPMARAMRRCSELVVIPPRMEHYAAISDQVFAIFREYSPLVEPLSLDEAFIDVSGTERLHGEPADIARAIKRCVRERLDLVVSIGVAPNKFVAKVASDHGKPDGLVVVALDEVLDFLHPLPVGRIFGVGKVTLKALGRMGITTIGELAAYPRDALRSRFGEHGEHLWSLSRGVDERAVEPRHEAKSLGHENTFAADKSDLEELTLIVKEQADRVAGRLRKHGLRAGGVMLKAKTADFKLLTRQRRLPRPTCDGDTLGRTAGELLAALMAEVPGPFRLTGVAGTDLTSEEEPRQLTLDEPEHKQREELARTLDAISARFGAGLVERASTLERKESRERRHVYEEDEVEPEVGRDDPED
jgi:DNA polymerase-4